MRGAKPKVYPDTMVEAVRCMYLHEGMTQAEVAEQLGTTQRVIFNVMRRHGIPTRTAVKRDQRGAANDSWRGSDATYTAFHARVEAARGKPSFCSECGAIDPALTYEWANLTGRYDDIEDYARMCRPCHRRYDNARRSATGIATSAHVRRRAARGGDAA